MALLANTLLANPQQGGLGDLGVGVGLGLDPVGV